MAAVIVTRAALNCDKARRGLRRLLATSPNFSSDHDSLNAFSG
jgi:hypothetical protein